MGIPGPLVFPAEDAAGSVFVHLRSFVKRLNITAIFVLATASSEEKASDNGLGRPVVIPGKQQSVLSE